MLLIAGAFDVVFAALCANVLSGPTKVNPAVHV